MARVKCNRETCKRKTTNPSGFCGKHRPEVMEHRRILARDKYKYKYEKLPSRASLMAQIEVLRMEYDRWLSTVY